MLQLFKSHNRNQVKVFAFASGRDDGSIERQVVKNDSDYFLDVNNMNPEAVCNSVLNEEIDILIDYDGLHDFNNIKALSIRCAYIQGMK
jgi:predicted O-linked N-acetylglucosamine transferase (SPINDLY family)